MDKVSSVSTLRELLYSETTKLINKETNCTQLATIAKSAGQIINSYRIQIVAMKLSGGAVDISKLAGLLP